MSGGAKVRVVLAKAGLDAHERGVHVVAHGLRDAGFEVIYLGLRRTPEQIVAAAIQEDADVIGLSSLTGSHRHFARRVLELMHDVPWPPLVVVGGLVSDDERRQLLEAGVSMVFPLETSISDIADALTAAAARRRENQHV